MLRELNVNWITWMDWVWLNQDEIKDILSGYRVHELDLEACLEQNQKARIDTYKKYSFLIFHFPKYDKKLQIYKLNEFSIFFWKDKLITFRKFSWGHIDKIFKHYDELKIARKNPIKITSGYIIYEMIQVMLEKMFKLIKPLLNLKIFI